MTPVTVLLWKEWRELRWFLITGLGIFLILPLIGAIEAHSLHNHRLELETTPWVVAFSGVLAVFIAVGSTCRDLSDRLSVFWQSRPISVGRWLGTKYLSGLALVLLLCTLPLAAEIAINHAYSRSTDAAMLVLLVSHPFVVMAIYSVAFLAGCLVRRVAQAAMLSLAAMLLIYFLPYVLPPLNWLSLAVLLETWSRTNWDGRTGTAGMGRLLWRAVCTPAHLHFVLGMLAFSGLSAIAAWIAVRNDLRVAADRKVMYWSIGLAGLLLLWATAYQVGSNLPVQQEMAMPGQHQMARAISVNGNRAVLFTLDDGSVPRSGPGSLGFVRWTLWPLEVTSSGVTVGRAVTLRRSNESGYVGGRGNLILADDGQHAYLLDWPNTAHPELLTVALDGEGSPVVHRLDLGDGPFDGNWKLHLAGNRLYIAAGLQLVTVDVSDPGTPRLLRVGRIAVAQPILGHDREIAVALFDLDGLSPRQRLEATVGLAPWTGYYSTYCLSGDVLIDREEQWLMAYRLTQLTDTVAQFELADEYRPTAIERFVHWPSGQTLTARNELAYATQGSIFGALGVTVYDASDPRHLRRTGHFAAPTRSYWPVVAPLADGRVLVGGTKLYLVGRPRGK